MPVPITAQSFSNLMQPGIKKAFFTSYDDTVKKEAMYHLVYGMHGSTTQNEYTLSISA